MLNLFLLCIIIALICLIVKSSLNNAKIAKQNIELQNRYLAENKLGSDVIETVTGLQYEMLVANSNGQQPSKASKVKCHYHGTLIDGTVFDSSVERNTPLCFSQNQVIPGWTEVLQLMKTGEKVKAVIPYNLAYGKRAVGKIPPASLLIFEIELLEVID
ncbi:FKBP-type peptidyl-prolyl cis-trans isomerase [Pseudoalteromonas sp.]|uniref:FKBP-type peptidyl-prolyl cis-trans isomerase n=1 Tax=Pseudoalteromonas sp. TaxID=53249 RepID=UPI0035686D00